MGADIETGIPANVVEIGTEVTQGIVDALNTAPSPTGVNRFVTINDLNTKASLSGDTFTGKINCTPVGGVAGINIGVGGTSASALNAGDIWIASGGASLNFRDGTGAWRVCAALGSTNAFTGTNTFVTQVATDNSTRAATTEFVRASVPSVDSWNLLTASVTTGSSYNNIVRLVFAGNSSIVFSAGNTLPIGSQWVFINTTTHSRTFSAGAGATLLSQGNKFVLNGQHSICSVIKTASNEYYISGNLV
jgi:hypothetical protein